MEDFGSIYDWVFPYLKNILFPEEWLDLDLNFSKMELVTLLLVEHEGEMSMSRICEAVNIPMSTATGIVDRLVKKGLLKRDRTENDRRLVLVFPSEGGKEVVLRCKKVMLEYVNAVEEALTEEEKQVLFKVFLKVVDVFKGKNEPQTATEKPAPTTKIEIE